MLVNSGGLGFTVLGLIALAIWIPALLVSAFLGMRTYRAFTPKAPTRRFAAVPTAAAVVLLTWLVYLPVYLFAIFAVLDSRLFN
jgi:hypothetical protein